MSFNIRPEKNILVDRYYKLFRIHPAVYLSRWGHFCFIMIVTAERDRRGREERGDEMQPMARTRILPGPLHLNTGY